MNPLTTLVLAAAIFVDARSILLGSNYHRVSEVGEWFRPSFLTESFFHAKPSSGATAISSPEIDIPNALPEPAIFWGSPGIHLLPEPATTQRLIHKDRGLHVVNPDEQSWDEGSRLFADESGNVLLVMLYHQTRVLGWWAPTRRETMCLMHVDYGSDLLPGERIAAIGMAIDAMQRDGVLPVECAQIAREGMESEKRTYWPGVWHDVASAVLAIAFLVSLGWVIEVPSWTRTGRARIRVAKGLCSACGYNLQGLAAGACPECGHVANAIAHASEPANGAA